MEVLLSFAIFVSLLRYYFIGMKKEISELKGLAVEYSLSAKTIDLHKVKFDCSYIAAQFARKIYGADFLVYESCYALFLSNRQTIKGYARIGCGGISSTIVDIRLVCKYAIDTLSSGVILVHNHPSGELSPSKLDKELTKRIADALHTLDIQMLDHIILTEDGYYSFADEGL